LLEVLPVPSPPSLLKTQHKRESCKVKLQSENLRSNQSSEK